MLNTRKPKTIYYDGNFEELLEKLNLDDRVVGMIYQDINRLHKFMEKKFNRKLMYSCYGDPLTVFFTV